MDQHSISDGSRSGVPLNDLSKNDMEGRIRQLEAHVTQLKNIIAKSSRKDHGKISKRDSKGKVFDFTKYNTRHVALKITYLGWDYQGLAVQEDTDNTIEAAIFDALKRTKLIEARESSNYHRCGRTDKGVSAYGQVISIDLRSNLLEGVGVKVRESGSAHERPGDKTTEIKYAHILNKVLPAEIRVLAWCPVDADFSARFSCRQRTYKYFFPRGNLNIEAMNAGAQLLLGEHDFRNLCKMDVGNGVTNYKRNIHLANISIIHEWGAGYDMCEATIIGQAFLWHQIRCIMALLFLIGQQKEQPQIISELLDIETHPRKPQYTMASELPLVLYDCMYENVNWIFDPEVHNDNIRHMQEMWTRNAVKCTLLKSMIDDLSHKLPASDIEASSSLDAELVLYQADSLMAASKSKVYKPLMERETCESLEERIAHFAKRRKLNKEDTDT